MAFVVYTQVQKGFKETQLSRWPLVPASRTRKCMRVQERGLWLPGKLPAGDLPCCSRPPTSTSTLPPAPFTWDLSCETAEHFPVCLVSRHLTVKCSSKRQSSTTLASNTCLSYYSGHKASVWRGPSSTVPVRTCLRFCVLRVQHEVRHIVGVLYIDAWMKGEQRQWSSWHRTWTMSLYLPSPSESPASSPVCLLWMLGRLLFPLTVGQSLQCTSDRLSFSGEERGRLG